MRVTALQQQRRGRRLNLFLDGRFALGLSADVVANAGLRVGDDLDDGALSALREAEARHGALSAALRLLSYRPRSETELRDRLARRRLAPPLVDETLDRLRHMGLVDDTAFARSWVESRERVSPRARRLLRHELRTKGVAAGAMNEPLQTVDEDSAALRAASRRATALRHLPYEDFQRRLGNFLLRRGFRHETIRRAVNHYWRELGGEAAEDSACDP